MMLDAGRERIWEERFLVWNHSKQECRAIWSNYEARRSRKEPCGFHARIVNYDIMEFEEITTDDSSLNGVIDSLTKVHVDGKALKRLH
jgi:hypothetical protein